jgi:hypothetical protein
MNKTKVFILIYIALNFQLCKLDMKKIEIEVNIQLLVRKKTFLILMIDHLKHPKSNGRCFKTNI